MATLVVPTHSLQSIDKVSHVEQDTLTIVMRNSLHIVKEESGDSACKALEVTFFKLYEAESFGEIVELLVSSTGRQRWAKYMQVAHDEGSARKVEKNVDGFFHVLCSGMTRVSSTSGNSSPKSKSSTTALGSLCKYVSSLPVLELSSDRSNTAAVWRVLVLKTKLVIETISAALGMLRCGASQASLAPWLTMMSIGLYKTVKSPEWKACAADGSSWDSQYWSFVERLAAILSSDESVFQYVKSINHGPLTCYLALVCKEIESFGLSLEYARLMDISADSSTGLSKQEEELLGECVSECAVSDPREFQFIALGTLVSRFCHRECSVVKMFNALKSCVESSAKSHGQEGEWIKNDPTSPRNVCTAYCSKLTLIGIAKCIRDLAGKSLTKGSAQGNQNRLSHPTVTLSIDDIHSALLGNADRDCLLTSLERAISTGLVVGSIDEVTMNLLVSEVRLPTGIASL